MNYQASLLKKKGQFGLVWLAAHHPTKLNRQEVIHINLAKITKEINEYLLNGESNKPKFSLVISSHLMLGLVILLNKKTVYLYDELTHLQQEIKLSYRPDLKKEKKVTKKGKDITLTTHHKRLQLNLDENLPGLLNISDIESLVEYETERLEETLKQMRLVKHDKVITMTDVVTDQIQADLTSYEEDLFGHRATEPEGDWITMGESYLQNLASQFEHGETASYSGIFEHPMVRESIEQTVKVKESKPTKRQPFLDLTNIKHGDIHPSIVQDEFTILTEEQEEAARRLQENMLLVAPTEDTLEAVPPLEPVQLFEETTDYQFHDQIQPVPPQQIEPEKEREEEAQVSSFKRPLPRTISLELQELEAVKTRKQELAAHKRLVNRKRLLRDENTVLNIEEMGKRMNELRNEEKQLKRRENKFLATLVKTKYDAVKFVDLFKEPSGQLARRLATRPAFTQVELNTYIMVNQMKHNLITAKVKDDKYWYLTQARDMAARRGLASPLPPMNLTEREQSSIEEQRKRESMIQTDIVISPKERPKRRETFAKPFMQDEVSTSRIPTEQVSISQQEVIPTMMADHQPTIDFQQPQFEPSFEQTFAAPQQVSMGEEAMQKIVEDKQIYEKIILDSLSQSTEKVVIFQEIIKDTSLFTQRCLESTKPKRMFASKMFLALLSLAGTKHVEVDQKAFYKDISITLS